MVLTFCATKIMEGRQSRFVKTKRILTIQTGALRKNVLILDWKESVARLEQASNGTDSFVKLINYSTDKWNTAHMTARSSLAESERLFKTQNKISRMTRFVFKTTT